ncbi:MAG: DUF2834 domain-containing protein [Paracoccus sp. (in: a-proteobacteria)]|nr:DUF2834 domain-containing protein [Paracoccus sp. (in: a-proteobacteria)]
MGFDLTPLRLVWLGAAVLGLVLAMATDVTRGPSDWLALAVLALWCLIETMVRRNWWALLTLPAMAFGIATALPLYLFIRSRRIV